MARSDPLRSFRFRLEIDGVQRAGFSECTGFDRSIDAIDYRQGSEPARARKLPGLAKYGNVILERGLTDSTELYDWHRQIVNGDQVRKNVAIVVVDEQGSEQARFEILEAWPCKYDSTELDAKSNDVGVETLELCNEGVNRVA